MEKQKRPEFFLDTADIKEVSRAMRTGLISGLTTNPKLIADTGKPREKIVPELCSRVPAVVSVEVVATKARKMVEEAERLFKLHPKVMVKIPMTTDGEGMAALAILRGLDEKWGSALYPRLLKWRPRYNVTLVFSPQQATLAAKLGADYVSPFFGRLTDAELLTEVFGVKFTKRAAEMLYKKTLTQTVTIFHQYGFTAKLLAASCRTPEIVVDALEAGYDAITMPPNVFWQLFRHPLSDHGLNQFLQAYEQAKKREAETH